MNRDVGEIAVAKSAAILHWQVMFCDDMALLAMQDAHHKALLRHAHALHRDHVIDATI